MDGLELNRDWWVVAGVTLVGIFLFYLLWRGLMFIVSRLLPGRRRDGSLAATVMLEPLRFAALDCSASEPCTSARALSRLTFPVDSELPKLPLNGCTSTRCGCQFRVFTDRRRRPRRSGYDRRNAPRTGAGATERRQRVGRRATETVRRQPG